MSDDVVPKPPLGLPTGSVRAIITLMLVSLLVFSGGVMILNPSEYVNLGTGGAWFALFTFTMSQVNNYMNSRNGKA